MARFQGFSGLHVEERDEELGRHHVCGCTSDAFLSEFWKITGGAGRALRKLWLFGSVSLNGRGRKRLRETDRSLQSRTALRFAPSARTKWLSWPHSWTSQRPDFIQRPLQWREVWVMDRVYDWIIATRSSVPGPSLVFGVCGQANRNLKHFRTYLKRQVGCMSACSKRHEAQIWQQRQGRLGKLLRGVALRTLFLTCLRSSTGGGASRTSGA